MSQHALCDHCASLRRLTTGGLLVLHYIRVPEHVPGTVRQRKTRRACPGSGRPPRRVEG